jgi:hypothetical protein
MRVIDIFSFFLSLLGIYGRVLHIRSLLPYYIIPSLSALLNETQHLLEHAEVIGAIPLGSVHRIQLDWYEDFSFFIFGSLSAHKVTQFREPIVHDAHREQLRMVDIPATAPCCSARTYLQALRPLLSNRSYQVTT